MLRGLGSKVQNAKCTCCDVPAVLFFSGLTHAAVIVRCIGEQRCLWYGSERRLITLRTILDVLLAHRDVRYLPRQNIMANTFTRLEHIPDVKKVR